MVKRVETAGGQDALTPAERRIAQVLAGDPNVEIWRAGWLAGYCGADPNGPEPPPSSPERKSLATSARRALGRPRVQAEIKRLRNAAAGQVMAEAIAGDPEGDAIVAARTRVLDAAVAEHDAVVLGASLLDLKLRASMADIGEFVSWDADGATVKGSDELTREQRQLVRKVQFHPTCGKCGAEHQNPGVTLELEPRATWAAQATKQLGLEAASKVEVAGKDGGPIQIGATLGLTRDTVLAVRMAIIGKPPPAQSEGGG